jgi:hypothetical protein
VRVEVRVDEEIAIPDEIETLGPSFSLICLAFVRRKLARNTRFSATVVSAIVYGFSLCRLRLISS